MSNKYQLAWTEGVCVVEDRVARRVGGKGKDVPSLFDGAVLFNQLTESDHCDWSWFRARNLWYIAVFWMFPMLSSPKNQVPYPSYLLQ